MSDPLVLVSSRAVERLLAALVDELRERLPAPVHTHAAGGVEVARRLREGETADVAVLAAGAVGGLADDGVVDPTSVTPLFDSQVALAVPAAVGDEVPLATDEDLLAVLDGAARVAYSTGPSGTALLGWLDDRGVRGRLEGRLVQAPAGTPVARLLADGDADVGVQQTSELAGVEGVRVVGPLPGSAAATSTFAGAVLRGSSRPAEAAALLHLLRGEGVAELVRAHRMDPAGG